MYYIVIYFEGKKPVIKIFSSLEAAGKVKDKIENSRIIRIKNLDDYISIRVLLT